MLRVLLFALAASGGAPVALGLALGSSWDPASGMMDMNDTNTSELSDGVPHKCLDLPKSDFDRLASHGWIPVACPDPQAEPEPEPEAAP
mmetsp:Transcript_95385/g.274673  ORF Transcript_95385/g.274673 Transcript_95385/m.274673 type:complete len:89 (+) Transcript_95385:86-352(+)